MTSEANNDGTSPPPLFLHARFEIPAAADSVDDVDDSGGQSSVDVVDQRFDASNCKPAAIGLPDGVEPAKPEPGDYTYSGMHDHGQLPKPREGGRFAQIIGFVNAAKKASDAYLTQVIEKKKALAATSLDGATGGENCSKKRKI